MIACTGRFASDDAVVRFPARWRVRAGARAAAIASGRDGR